MNLKIIYNIVRILNFISFKFKFKTPKQWFWRTRVGLGGGDGWSVGFASLPLAVLGLVALSPARTKISLRWPRLLP